MKRLIIAIIAGTILLTPTELPAKNTSTVPYYMYNAASNFNIDVALLYAICKVESNCKTTAINDSDSNTLQRSLGIVQKSYGLFQIKLATAKSLGFVSKETVKIVKKKNNKTTVVFKNIDHTKDLLDPAINAWFAAKLLRHLFNKYHDTSKVLSAYNAGRVITSNKPYVTKILNAYANYKMEKRY